MQTVTVDFETAGIEARPAYPPKPVGVAVYIPGYEPRYMAWGHPTANNCSEAEARQALQSIWDSGDAVLCHNTKFDLDVAETHLGLPLLPWERTHDTLFEAFLNDPHSRSLSLKPLAKELLGMEPEEQSAVRDWLVAHGIVKKNQKDWGAHICKAPGDLVGKYAVGDVVRTAKLHEKLYGDFGERMRAAYDRERRLMPILLRNEREGMRVDVEGLERDLGLFQSAQLRAEEWLRAKLNAPILNLDADADVAEALKSAGIVTEWKKTATGKASTSKKVLTPDKFKDPQVASVLGYRNRLETVIANSMKPWLAQAKVSKGYISTEWSQVRSSDEYKNGFSGTRTGRLSCSRFQNIAKSFEGRGDGYVHPDFLEVPALPLVRRYLLPDPGELFAHRDLSQQEFRLLAHYESGMLMRAYRENAKLDLHGYIHDLIRDLTRLDLPRTAVKGMNFGKLYGMGKVRIQETLKCDEQTATKFITAHRAALPDLAGLERSIRQRARAGEPIYTWGGRRYYCEPPKTVNGEVRSLEYKLLNVLIQGSAADWTKEAIIRYDSMRKHGRMLVTVHDEINISVPKEHLETEMRILKEAMEDMPLDLKMLSEPKVGPSWGDLKKYEEVQP